MLLVVHLRLQYVPPPLPATADATLFSEQRAMAHVQHLAGVIGDRQVSTPGLREATEYLVSILTALKNAVAGRFDVTVQVVTTTVSGAIPMSFTRINFTNAYRALDNVALIITPKGTEHLKALMVVSHHDSPVCSQGASDDGMPVAVMLELARALLAPRAKLPATPLILLWTGGEEPISPAAHGWSTTSPLYAKVGAFVNLEAMGSAGLPIVFQHTGSWALKAFSDGAPLPRGSRVAQDIFDLHIIPADSDFRMFSARHYGSLPGVDVAYVIGSTVYHSYLDAPHRVRPGLVQELGDGLMGSLASLSHALALRHAPGRAVTERQERADAEQRSVYFDILGLGMVVYSDDLADMLHNVPLVLLVLLPSFLYQSDQQLGRMRQRHIYHQMFSGAYRSFASMVLGLGAPMLLGTLRSIATGKPMVWFAHHWVGHVQFMPIAAAAALLPWLDTRKRCKASKVLSAGGFMSTQIAGCALAVSLVGAGLTWAGMRGNAMIFCMNGLLGLAVQGLLLVPAVGFDTLAMVMFLSLVPLAVGGAIVMVFVNVMMERMALSGSISVWLADVIVAALSGAGVLAATCGVYLPLLGYSLPSRVRKPLMASLVATSLFAAAWSAAMQPAYTPDAPKRVAVSHVVQTALIRQPEVLDESSPLDIEVVSEAVSLAGFDSTPLEKVVDMSRFTPVPPVGREFQGLYPLDTMLAGPTVEVPASTSTPSGDGLIDRARRYAPTASSFCHAPSAPSVANSKARVSAGTVAAHGIIPGLAPLPLLSPRPPRPACTDAEGGSKGMAEPNHPESRDLVRHLPHLQLVAVDSVEPHGPGTPRGLPAGAPRPLPWTRLTLRLYSQLPCWGILNVTGGALRAWSLNRQLAPSAVCKTCGEARQHMVRFVTQDQDPYWQLHLDLLSRPLSPSQPGQRQQRRRKAASSASSAAPSKGSASASPQLEAEQQSQGELKPHKGQVEAPAEAPAVWRPRKPLAWQLATPPSSLVQTLPAELAGNASVLQLLKGVVGQVRLELSVSYLHRTPTLRRVLGMLPPFTAETWLATTYQSFWEVF